MIAGLPMYERAETVAAHDILWDGIRRFLLADGFDAPAGLCRDIDNWRLWRDPDLVLAQTCGLPFREHLHCAVHLVGTPDYGLPGLDPGFYFSVIVARAGDPRKLLADFAGARFAYNDALSQSGWAAPAQMAARRGLRLNRAMRTGGHRASVVAVAGGSADLAAIDAVTWRDLGRFEPGLTGQLQVLGHTDATPGLPCICSRRFDPAPIRHALAAAIDGLDSHSRDLLGLAGLALIPASEYLAVPTPEPPGTPVL